MNKISGKRKRLSRLISLSAAGALIGSTGVYAADNQNVTSQPSQEKVNAPQFSVVDQNRDQQVVWMEIHAIYDDELLNAGWEERDVFDRYDADRNDSLDENEYLVFVSALAADPASNLSAQSAQQGAQQDSSTTATGQDSSVAGTSSQQQGDPQEEPGLATTDEQQSDRISPQAQGTTAVPTEEDSSMAGRTGAAGTSQQDSGSVTGTGQQDDEVTGTTSQQEDPSSADYDDQQSQTSTGGAQSQPLGEGADDQSIVQEQSPQSQDQSDATGSQQQQEQAGTTTTIIAITDIPNITAEELRDRQVVNLGGEEIGEVEDVVLGADGVISGLVVGVGGFWDIGDKDVYASASELRVSGDQIIWETTLDEDALKELPEYETPEVSAIE